MVRAYFGTDYKEKSEKTCSQTDPVNAVCFLFDQSYTGSGQQIAIWSNFFNLHLNDKIFTFC